MAERITAQKAVLLARAEHGTHIHARIQAAILAAGGDADLVSGALEAFKGTSNGIGRAMERLLAGHYDTLRETIALGIVEATLRAAGLYAEIPAGRRYLLDLGIDCLPWSEFPAWHRAFFDPSFTA